MKLSFALRGKRIVVTADRGTELHDFLDGIASLVPAGDTAALVLEIRACLDADRDPGPAGRAKAASSLSREGCLAAFERVLAAPAGRKRLDLDPETVSAQGLRGPPSS